MEGSGPYKKWRIRIWESQKYTDLTDPDPQHCFAYNMLCIFYKTVPIPRKKCSEKKYVKNSVWLPMPKSQVLATVLGLISGLLRELGPDILFVQFRSGLRIKVKGRIRIRINLQMTSQQNVWNMSLFEHFFKVMSLYLEARIRIRIK